MSNGSNERRSYDPLDRATFEAIAYNAVGRASEIGTYPALSLTHSSGSSGWSVRERVPPSAGEARHYHAEARQFFYVLSGTATMEFDDGKVRFGPNRWLHVPPGTPHRFFNESGADVEFLVISSPATAGDRVDLAQPRRQGG